jgi:hypothetical protein
MVRLSTCLATLGLLGGLVMAHPGHDHSVEAAERRSFVQQLSARSLDHCAAKLRARGYEQKAMERRQARAVQLRKSKRMENSTLATFCPLHVLTLLKRAPTKNGQLVMSTMEHKVSTWIRLTQ